MLVLLICATFSVYFTHHTLYGRYGFEAHERLTARSKILDFEVSSLKAVRDKLRQDISLLKTEPPHADLVEEFARTTLGFAYPDELLIVPRP